MHIPGSCLGGGGAHAGQDAAGQVPHELIVGFGPNGDHFRRHDLPAVLRVGHPVAPDLKALAFRHLVVEACEVGG